MNGARVLALSIAALGCALLGYLVHASLQSSFFTEGPALMDYVWFRATLIDFYIGIAFMIAWVFYRERRTWVAAAWSVAFVLTGNLAVALYLVIALWRVQSREDIATFFMGARATG